MIGFAIACDMSVIYISSTDEDLKEYREEVAKSLSDFGYAVESMDKYPARDSRPRSACEEDVSKCDIYVGLFAYMYGSCPTEDNPEKKSFTELEYLAAEKKPRFVFLMADDFPWPSTKRDAETKKDTGKRIRALRETLKKELWVASFRTPDHLAKQVLISIGQYEKKRPVQNVDAIEKLKDAPDLGPSYLGNIQEQIEKSRSVEFVAIRLGPTPWWNTRLHLVAALAADFTKIRAFVILDTAGQVLVVASPDAIRLALTKADHRLEIAYQQSRAQARGVPQNMQLDSITMNYPGQVMSAFGNKVERDVKQVLDAPELLKLGIKDEGEVLQQLPGERTALLKGTTPYIVLAREGKVEGIIDREELASRMAKAGIH